MRAETGRRGVVDVADDAVTVTVTDHLADRDPVLAALASASVLGLPPAGPARRKPTLVALLGHGGHALMASPVSAVIVTAVTGPIATGVLTCTEPPPKVFDFDEPPSGHPHEPPGCSRSRR